MAKLKVQVQTKVRNGIAPDILSAQRRGQTNAPVGSPENPSDKILTLANLITLCRFLLTIAFLVLFVRGEHRVLALSFYTTAAVTDFLDGWVARTTQTVSWFGKVADPIMDRVLLFVGVLGLVVKGELPLWVAVFVIGRDAILLGGNIYLRKFWKRPVDVIYLGKVATALFMVGFCIMLVGWPTLVSPALLRVNWLPGFNGGSVTIGIYFIYVAVVCSTITAVIYYKQGFAIKDRVLEERGVQVPIGKVRGA